MSNKQEYVLELKNIVKRFPGVLALDKVKLQLIKGEVNVLLGENGAGKSTLIKVMTGAFTPDEIIEMAMQGEYTNMPGVEWKYCNTGYTIMAKLIEKLSGMSFDDYLNKKIFYPLNMKNTYACSYYKNADDAVPRYFKDSTGYIPATQMHFSNLIGGGNVISNVSDMGIWTNVLINGNNLPSNYQLLWKSNTITIRAWEME